MRALWMAVVLAGTLVACRDGTAPVDGLVVSAGTTEMIEGRTTPLTVRLDGEVVDPAEVQWESRDPFTIDVVGSIAHARAPGLTWLVARVGELRDSVRVGVRFTGLELNRVGVLISSDGEIAHRFSLGGASLLLELPNSRTHTLVHASAGRSPGAHEDDLFAYDTVVSLRLENTPAVGLRSLPPMIVQEMEDGGFGFLGAEGLIMRMIEHEPEYAVTYYVAVTDSPLEFTTVDVPAEAGVDYGTVAGRIAFEAAGFRVVFPTPPALPRVEQIGESTVRIYVEFTTDLYRVPVPFSGFAVAGTPYAGTANTAGFARMREGVLELRQESMINFRQPGERFIRSKFAIAAPAVGTFDFAQVGAQADVDFLLFVRSNPDLDGGDLVPETSAIGRTGTVTITEYRPPTERAYGFIAGTYTATLDFGAEHPEYQTTFESSFRMPIDPLLGSPTSLFH
jgi:hypothetical protein